MTRNVIVVGVGGHGVLTASRILAEAALASGLDVRRSEVHGMSQRGGSVVSHVRYGERIHAPLVARGTAHALLAFEKLEALRNIGFLREGGILLASDRELPPARVGRDPLPYPGEIEERCRARVPRARFFPTPEIARELGEPRVANLVLLGAYAALAPEVAAGAWRRAVEEAFPPPWREVNLEAMARGRALMADRDTDPGGESGAPSADVPGAGDGPARRGAR